MKTKILLLFALLFSSTNLFAHPLLGTQSGFSNGFFHPLSGLDHILAMLAVGIWAAQMGGKAKWIIPITFVGLMSVGGVLGMNNINLPFAEIGILVSVVVLGVLILAGVKLPMLVSSVLVGVFALCHGHTHGTELPAAASGVMYAAGFALTTIVLHLSGIGFGTAVNKIANEKIVKFSGAMIAIAGLFLSYNYFIQ
ncbi:MAG: HupE/UreJ family protein [Ignavibacteria bacterium]|nr:HupE/UreJ family protein [Ignavibacteria bacterium]